MKLDIARDLIRTLPPTAVVLDVGGGASPFPRADYVLDLRPYGERGTGSSGSAHQHLADVPVRYSPDTWVVRDVCEHRPWSFGDGQFDFVVCSHLLEDVRDPVWVCSELGRVARAGYIETPGRALEQSLGVEHPLYCGYYHHRWLVTLTADGRGLEFRHKPHSLHSLRDAHVCRIRPGYRLHPSLETLPLHWRDALPCREVHEFHPERTEAELIAFAQAVRRTHDLVVPNGMPLLDRLRRRLFDWRRSRGCAWMDSKGAVSKVEAAARVG